MRKNLFPVLHLFVIIIISSCNAGNNESQAGSNAGVINVIDMPAAKTFIDSINMKFTEQVRSGDSVALASHYWPEAELLLSNSESIKGKDILSAWGSMIRMGVKDFTFQTTDITLGGDLLVETGTYDIKGTDPSLNDRGKYVVIWKYKNGEWKLFRDIGNTSLPMPPAR